VRKRSEERGRAAAADAVRKEKLLIDAREKLDAAKAAQAKAEQQARDQLEPLRRSNEKKEAALRSLRAKHEATQQQLDKALETTAALEANMTRGRPGGGSTGAWSPQYASGLLSSDEALSTLKIGQEQLRLVLQRVVRSLESGVANPDEERHVAMLSHSLLQLSPEELGLSTRADIGTPTCSGAVRKTDPPMNFSQEQEFLRQALAEPVDVDAAYELVMRLVQALVVAALAQQRVEAEQGQMLNTSFALADYEAMLQSIRQQVAVEKAESDMAIAERDVRITELVAASRVQSECCSPVAVARAEPTSPRDCVSCRLQPMH
jgi:hypothetical protein